jgi:hypothetical protein
MTRTAAVLPAAALLAACATLQAYDGPRWAAGELALIDGDPRINAGLPLAAVIRKIDARVVGVGYSRVTVAPGSHLLLVDCVMAATHTTSRFELNVSVEAGRRYRLVSDSAPGNGRCGAVRLEDH